MVSSLWMDHGLIVSPILGVGVLQGELRTQIRKLWSQWGCGKIFNENIKKIFRKHAHAQSLSRICLCNPMDCSRPVSSVHGILQARTLEWVAISFSLRKQRRTLNSALGCLAEGSGTTSQNDATQLRGFHLTWPVYPPLHKCWKGSHPSAPKALK